VNLENQPGREGFILLLQDEAHRLVIIEDHPFIKRTGLSPFHEHVPCNLPGRRCTLENARRDGLFHERMDDIGLFQPDRSVLDLNGA